MLFSILCAKLCGVGEGFQLVEIGEYMVEGEGGSGGIIPIPVVAGLKQLGGEFIAVGVFTCGVDAC